MRWVDDGTAGQSTVLESYSITVAYWAQFTDETVSRVTQQDFKLMDITKMALLHRCTMKQMAHRMKPDVYIKHTLIQTERHTHTLAHRHTYTYI